MVNERFVPIKIHIKENPTGFERFGAQWTPTVIVADPDGTERYRFEGYLPAEDFLAQLGLVASSIGMGTLMPPLKRCTGQVYRAIKQRAMRVLYRRLPGPSSRGTKTAAGQRKRRSGLVDHERSRRVTWIG
jgi:hypothetical protein